ncbi:MAG: hypothetical protein ABI230_10860, partial [Aestuariivirga sp.]
MTIVIRLLAVIVMLTIASPVSWSDQSAPNAGVNSTQPQVQSTQDKANSTNSIQTTLSPAPITENLKPVTVPEPIKAGDNGGRNYSSSDWWLVYLTGGLVLVTLGLAIFTGKLYSATVQLGRDAKKSGESQTEKMEASIAQAERAANAAETSANATKYLAEADRAWVVNSENIANLALQNMGEGHISVLIVWANAGRSPAINVSFDAQYRFIGQGDPLPHFVANHSSMEGRAPMGQGIKFQAEEIKAAASFFDGLLSGRWRLIVYSSVQYET